MTPPISNTTPLRKHILTAAHCFDKPSRTASNVDVRIGQDNIKEEEWQGTEANIARVKIHERWVNVTSRGLHSTIAYLPLIVPGTRGATRFGGVR